MTPRSHDAEVPNSVRVLSQDECWRTLESHNFGRFAVQIEDGVDVFPVNYLVHNRELYFRSAPGSKLLNISRAPKVAFEIDGQLAHRAWSVVVHGIAHRLRTDLEIAESGVDQLRTWYPGDKLNYVRVAPEQVTGRSFFRTLDDDGSS